MAQHGARLFCQAGLPLSVGDSLTKTYCRYWTVSKHIVIQLLTMLAPFSGSTFCPQYPEGGLDNHLTQKPPGNMMSFSNARCSNRVEGVKVRQRGNAGN